MGEDNLDGLKKRLLHAIPFMIVIFSAGTIGYRIISGGKSSWIDCAYMTLITLSTVGFGEIVDLSASPGGRIFTMCLIVVGISGFLYCLSILTAFLVEGELLQIFRRNRMQKTIDKLDNHYIICGAGETGKHIIREFMETGRPFVVIEINQQHLEARQEELSWKNPIWILGDATNDETLIKAGLEKAKGVITCVTEDKDNLLITLTSRQLNEQLRIVSRCKDNKMISKIKKNGADSVVSPNFIGGMRIASEMVRPASVNFLDMMLRDKGQNLRVEEIDIPDFSKMIGKTMSAVNFWHIAGLFPIALQTDKGQWVYNPAPDTVINKGMKLIFVGSTDQRNQLETACSHT
jgi:voltage-gated potassium channel